MNNPTTLDVNKRLEILSRMGDPLERLNSLIPWETFRPLLETIHEKPRKSNAGRKSFDVILMFKLLIIQTLYNISDLQLEFQVRDRLTFMRFLGLDVASQIPDATTVWLFREKLKKLNLIDKLFDEFDSYLEDKGFEAKSGQIIDATIVLVPIQRNTKEENEKIKNDEIPKDWKDAKLEQKDTDARWTKKHGKSYYGYKNHVSVDAKHKIIRNYDVTPANVHDSQLFDKIIDFENPEPDVWADSAYRSEETEATLADAGFVSHISEKGQKNKKLTDEQRQNNRERSRIRSRVEHIFGFQENSMGGKLIRTIGKARARVKIGMMNLTYNMMRYLQLLNQRDHAPIVA